MADRIELRDGWRIETHKKSGVLMLIDEQENLRAWIDPDGTVCSSGAPTWAVAELLKAGGVEVRDG